MPKKSVTLFSPILCLALFILPILLASGCRSSEEKHVRQTLKRAEKLMWTHADSSLLALKSVTNFSMRGETQARYALLITQASYRNNQPPTSDSLIRIAVDYYDNSSDSLRKAWGNFYLGCFKSEKGLQEEAVKHFQKAEIAGKGVADALFWGLLYDSWGVSLQNVKPYENALNMAIKSKKFFEEAKDTVSLIYSYRNIGWNYYLLGNEERSKTYLNLATDQAIQLNRTEKLPSIYLCLAFVNEVYKHYDEALQQINLAQKYAQANKDSRMEDIYATKAYIFKALESYDSAKCYILKSDTSSFRGKAILHMELSEMNKAEGNISAALHHQELYANNLDSFYNHQTDEKLAELQKTYDFSKVQYENERLKGKARDMGILALAILLLGLAGFFFFYYRHNKKEKKRNEILQSMNDIINQNMFKLQQTSNELLIQQQLLQEKEQDLRLAIERQKGLEQKLKESSQENTEMEQLSELMAEQKALKERIFHANEVVKKIEKLKQLNAIQKRSKKSDLLLSPEECRELYEAVNYTYNNMESFLRENYPLLSEGDIFICCLLRMEVSNGDICLLTGSSEAALKKRKYRIKHDKMKNTEEGVSLDDILKRI